MKFIRVIKSSKNNILSTLQKLLPQFEIHQTDEWIYVNDDNHPDNTLAIIPEDYPTYKLLDDENMPIDEGQWTIEAAPTFSKDWIKELADNIKSTIKQLPSENRPEENIKFVERIPFTFSYEFDPETIEQNSLIVEQNGTSGNAARHLLQNFPFVV